MQVQNYVKEKCEFGGMTSLTQTSTSIPDVMLRLRNRSVASWPNPERSIDDNDKGVLVGKKTYWAVTGAAEAAYKTIAHNILQCLTERSNDLYEGLDESSVPHSVGCFMVGKDKRRAAPFIVIACKIGDFCHRVMDIIKAAEWWKSFLRAHEGFGRFSLLPYPPRRMGESDTMTHAWAYTSANAQMLYGAPIFFSPTAEPTLARATVRQATLGLLLYVDGGLYGLTVAHPLTDGMRDQPLGQHTEELIPFYEDSIDSGTDSDTDSDSDFGSQYALGSPPSTSPSTVHNHTPQQTEDFIQTTEKPICLGRVDFRSSGGPDDSCDWALIDLRSNEETYFRLLRRTVLRLLSDSFLPEEWQDSSCSFPKRTADAISHAARIFALDNDQKLTSGTLSPSQSFICLAGTRKYTSAHNVVLDQAITPGRCGAAVVDAHGNWYGHIVAGNSESALAYVSPAAQTIREIEASLDASKVQPLCVETLRHLFDAAVVAADHQEMAAFAQSKMDLSTKDRNGETLLSKASYLGQERAVEMLLESGVDLNAHGGKHGNALCAAASQGHTAIVKQLVLAGADVTAQPSARGTALSLAAEHNHIEVLKFLLTCGVGSDIENMSNNSAIHNAAANGHKQIVELLFEAGARGTALQGAASKGHEAIVRFLLAAGADIDAQAEGYGSALQGAARRDQNQIVQLLIDAGANVNAQGGYRGNALQAAAYGGSERATHLLLDAGADVNAPGGCHGNALQAAARRGHDSVLRLLLDAGADVNAQGGLYGNALQAAASGGHEEISRILLNNGASVNTQGGIYGNALFAAAFKGYGGILRLLLGAGAAVNAWGAELGTALQAAAYKGHTGSLCILLDAGADMNIQQGKYGSALQAAMHKGQTDIIEILRYAATNPGARKDWLSVSSAAKPKFTDKEYVLRHQGKKAVLQKGTKHDASDPAHPTEF